MSSFPAVDVERHYSAAEARASLEPLIREGKLSSSETVVIQGMIQGFEKGDLGEYVKDRGVSPSSVRQLRKRALQKLRSVAN